MPLSEEEQRILSEIEQQLYQTDPGLARDIADPLVWMVFPGGGLITAMVYVLLNLFIDVMYGVIDPRVGIEG